MPSQVSRLVMYQNAQVRRAMCSGKHISDRAYKGGSCRTSFKLRFGSLKSVCKECVA